MSSSSSSQAVTMSPHTPQVYLHTYEYDTVNKHVKSFSTWKIGSESNEHQGGRLLPEYETGQLTSYFTDFKQKIIHHPQNIHFIHPVHDHNEIYTGWIVDAAVRVFNDEIVAKMDWNIIDREVILKMVDDIRQQYTSSSSSAVTVSPVTPKVYWHMFTYNNSRRLTKMHTWEIMSSLYREPRLMVDLETGVNVENYFKDFKTEKMTHHSLNVHFLQPQGDYANLNSNWITFFAKKVFEDEIIEMVDDTVKCKDVVPSVVNQLRLARENEEASYEVVEKEEEKKKPSVYIYEFKYYKDDDAVKGINMYDVTEGYHMKAWITLRKTLFTWYITQEDNYFRNVKKDIIPDKRNVHIIQPFDESGEAVSAVMVAHAQKVFTDEIVVSCKHDYLKDQESLGFIVNTSRLSLLKDSAEDNEIVGIVESAEQKSIRSEGERIHKQYMDDMLKKNDSVTPLYNDDGKLIAVIPDAEYQHKTGTPIKILDEKGNPIDFSDIKKPVVVSRCNCGGSHPSGSHPTYVECTLQMDDTDEEGEPHNAVVLHRMDEITKDLQMVKPMIDALRNLLMNKIDIMNLHIDSLIKTKASSCETETIKLDMKDGFQVLERKLDETKLNIGCVFTKDGDCRHSAYVKEQVEDVIHGFNELRDGHRDIQRGVEALGTRVDNAFTSIAHTDSHLSTRVTGVGAMHCEMKKELDELITKHDVLSTRLDVFRSIRIEPLENRVTVTEQKLREADDHFNSRIVGMGQLLHELKKNVIEIEDKQIKQNKAIVEISGVMFTKTSGTLMSDRIYKQCQDISDLRYGTGAVIADFMILFAFCVCILMLFDRKHIVYKETLEEWWKVTVNAHRFFVLPKIDGEWWMGGGKLVTTAFCVGYTVCSVIAFIVKYMAGVY